MRPAVSEEREGVLRDTAAHRPPDLDAGEAARWDEYRAELEAALANDEPGRALHAQAMLHRVRYGSQ